MKRNLYTLIACIDRFLHFYGIFILKLKKYQKNFPFSKQNTFILVFLSVSLLRLFSRHAGLDHFYFPKEAKEMGKFWRKFGTCYRNANYCQIEIGKLKTLGRKSTLITTWRFMRTFVADKRYRLQWKIIVYKKSIEAVSGFCVRWSRTHMLSVTVN